MSQEQFDRLPREEQRRLVGKQYGGEIPPAIQEEQERRLKRRAKGIPVTEDHEPADRINLTLKGPPRTKKNHKTAAHVEGPAYRKYHEDAIDQLQFVHKLRDIDYHIEAHFYVDSYGKAADLLGLEQALADTLQDAKVVTNDRQFRSWDGSRAHHDHGTEPRTEITIAPLPDREDA